MLSNYIGGGQVFLHKLRMLRQVVGTTIFVSLISGVLLTMSFNNNESNVQRIDWDGAITYAKAKLAITVHPALDAISIRSSAANVDAYSNNTLWKKKMLASSVMTSPHFILAWSRAVQAVKLLALQAIGFGTSAGLLVFLFWSKFGKGLREDKQQEGSGVLLTADQVQKKLKRLGKCSDLKISKMPLVKDMETRHFLVTGGTGSGKTNLIHNLLPQVEAKRQPVIVIDQTGEMISKYYNSERGDIIFNPLDTRGHTWDFWTDCSTNEELERFTKILIGFNRKQSGAHSDPFWENAAETVFNACVEYLRPSKASIQRIANMVCHSEITELEKLLAGTQASRYLNRDSKQTAASILSVLASNAKPMTYLRDNDTKKTFSMKQHFANIKNGSDAWLFLATKPSARALTLPLIACLTELALATLMEIGIDEKRRVWVIIDEFASLGKLPALSPLMAEGRKYGACVVAGMQSLNQLYEHYGQYAGSTIFGQFGTSFFFQNREPAIAKMVSSMYGQQTIIRQQKNTSFGANEFRDGVSYTEQQQKEFLVKTEDLANLAIGECYVLLPDPVVRLSKIQTKEANVKAKCEGFVQEMRSNFQKNINEVANNDEEGEKLEFLGEAIDKDKALAISRKLPLEF